MKCTKPTKHFSLEPSRFLFSRGIKKPSLGQHDPLRLISTGEEMVSYNQEYFCNFTKPTKHFSLKPFQFLFSEGIKKPS